MADNKSVTSGDQVSRIAKSGGEQELAFFELQQATGEVLRNNKLLRNRVRMLQQEHEKAQRKIQETSKKTDELLKLRQANDDKYIRVSAAALTSTATRRA